MNSQSLGRRNPLNNFETHTLDEDNYKEYFGDFLRIFTLSSGARNRKRTLTHLSHHRRTRRKEKHSRTGHSANPVRASSRIAELTRSRYREQHPWERIFESWTNEIKPLACFRRFHVHSYFDVKWSYPSTMKDLI